VGPCAELGEGGKPKMSSLIRRRGDALFLIP
jgi:hypothetical protein